MRPLKRLTAILLTTFMTITVACANTSETGTTAEDQEKVTITYSLWGSDEREAYTRESIAAFEERNPNIEVELHFYKWKGFEKLMRIMVAGGTQADVMQINYGWQREYANKYDAFADLNDYKDVIDFSVFNDTDLAFGQEQGNQVAIPIAMNTAIPIYNKTIYEKYGLSTPKTWDDLFKCASRMREDGVYPLIVEDSQMCSLMFTYYEQLTGKEAFAANGESVLSQKGVEHTLEFFRQLKAQHAIMMVDSDGLSMIDQGKAAGVYGWLSSIDNYEDRISSAGGSASLGELILLPDATRLGYYLKPASMLAISKTCEHPEEAAKFIEFLSSSKENALLQKSEKGIPASKAAEMVLMEDDELNGIGYRAKILLDYNATNLTVKPTILEEQDFLDNCNQYISKYFMGEYTVEETAKFIRTITVNLSKY